MSKAILFALLMFVGSALAERVTAQDRSSITYLSDMQEIRSGNLHGGLGKDRSYWSKELQIAGCLFSKGLVTHPKADGSRAFVEYDLSHRFSAFYATLGSAEGPSTHGTGLMIYRIFVDGRLAASGRVPNHPAVVQINVAVADAIVLRLEVDDGGDGNNSDQAAWGYARLEKRQSTSFLSDMIESRKGNLHGGLGKDRPFWGGDLIVGQARFAKGIVTHPPAANGQRAFVAYDLRGDFNSFYATLGSASQNGNSGLGTMNYYIIVDGRELESGPFPSPPAMKQIAVSVKDARSLRLEVDNGGNGNNSDHAAWGNARLIRRGPSLIDRPSVDDFPIGWYNASFCPASTQLMAEDGVNLVLVYHRANQPDTELISYLEGLKSAGLRALVEIRPLNRTPSGPYDPAELKKFIQALKHRAEIWGWYLYDEPPNVDLLTPERAIAAYRIIKAEDQTRPIALVFSKGGEPQKYQEAMDVFMFDDYFEVGPTEFDFIGFGDGDYFRLLAAKSANSVDGRNYWPVLQAFEAGRFPTIEEERYLVYSAVQAGANGLFFWTHTASSRSWADSVLAPVLDDFARYSRAFSNGALQAQVSASEATTVATLYAVPHSSEYLVLLIHHGKSAVTTRVTLSPPTRISTVTEGGRVLPLTGNSFTDDIGPYEVRLYSVR